MRGTFWSPTLYADVRRLAGSLLRQRRSGDSMSVTIVINEAFARMANSGSDTDARSPVRQRAAFFALLRVVMRSVITDWVRRRIRRSEAIPLDPAPAEPGASPPGGEQLPAALAQAEAISDALERLAKINPRAAVVAEFRFIRGMSVSEVSQALGISERAVGLDWAGARAWLKRELIDLSDPRRAP
ncbi:MAG: sigma-70 family RNA polymerase sigma factor [Phycisphaerales bacterium]